MRKHNFKGLHRMDGAPGYIWLMGEQIYGVWLEGDLLCNPKANTACIVQHTDNGDVVLEVIPETVCESTGQMDRNGIEIFENDVCRFYAEGEHSDYCIRWDEKNCRYVVAWIGNHSSCDELDDFFCENCTVIGSVWMHGKEEIT